MNATLYFRIFLGVVILAISPSAASHTDSTLGAPTPPASVDAVIYTPNHGYRFRYDDDPGSPHYYPQLKALSDTAGVDRHGASSPGNPRGYHDGYVALGFAAPVFSGERDVWYWDCSDGDDFDCNNGLSRSEGIYLPAPLYDSQSASCTRMILGHELFHRVQGAYKNAGAPSVSSWAIEGQARMMQDKVYTDLDTDPAASCIAEYLDQVNSYLADSNRTIWDTSYSAALFWNYLTEQYGTAASEPGRGVDFVAGWWFAAVLLDDPGSIETTDYTIESFADGESMQYAFRSFLLANLLKDYDLSARSQAFRNRYSYRDEDPNGPIDQNLYAEIVPDGTTTVSDASNNRFLGFGAAHYGGVYLRFDVSQCSAGRTLHLSFNPATQDPFFGNPLETLGAWAAVFSRGQNPRPLYHYRKVDHDWSITLLQTNPPMTRVDAIVSGMRGPILGNVRLQCLNTVYDPVIEGVGGLAPILPAQPGLATVFDNLFVNLGRAADAGGFDAQQFSVNIGSASARVLAAVSVPGGQRVAIEVPPVSVSSPLTFTAAAGIAPVTIVDAVAAAAQARQVTVLMDMSTSMLQPVDGSRIQAARAATRLFFDSLSDDVRAGLATFSGDGVEPNFDALLRTPMATLDATQRNRLRSTLDGLTVQSGRFTAVGDALQLGMNEFAARGSAGSRHLILISDGGENEGAFYAELRSALRAAQIRVHTIALGARADQGLLARIAAETGGIFHYVDAEAPATDLSALQTALVDLADRIEDRQLVFERSIPIGPSGTFTIDVPAQTIGLLLPAVQKIREAAMRTRVSASGQIAVSLLALPSGQPVTVAQQFDDPTHTAFQWSSLEPGGYRLVVQTGPNVPVDTLTVQFAAQTPAGPRLLAGIARPSRQSQLAQAFQIGQPLSLAAAAYASAPGLTVRSMSAEVRRGQPAGAAPLQVQRVVMQPTAERSEGGRVASWDHTFEMRWLGTSRGSSTGFADPPSGLAAAGSQRVTFRASVDNGIGGSGELILRESFHVLTPATGVPDVDADGLPDAYEETLACLNVVTPALTNADHDNDGVFTVIEYQQGTDPCAADTDGGGEDDGSENARGRDPLFADDDAIKPLRFLRIDHSPPDHEDEEPVLTRALNLEWDWQQSHDEILLYSAIPPAPPVLVARIQRSAANGESHYLHRDLQVGQQYCYFARAVRAGGTRGAATPSVCDVVRNDATTPWGSIVVGNAAPRSDATSLRVDLAVYNRQRSTMQYALGVDAAPLSPFQAFQPTLSLPMPQVTAPRRVVVRVVFRDAEGNLSTEYQDALTLYPPASLAHIRGSVSTAQRAGNGVGALGVWVHLVDALTEPSAVTDAEGAFTLSGLRPGAYTVNIGHPGYETVEQQVQLGAGQTVILAPVTLVRSDAMFADGFEAL